MAFGIWDYCVVLLMLVLSCAVGVYYRFTGGKQKTSNEYLLADRQMNYVPLAFSIATTFMSAITLLGITMENYQYGTMFSIIDVSYVFTTPIIVYLLAPVFYQLKSASVYEYLEYRFGYATRLSTSFVYCLQMILYMGIALIAPAITLEAVTGVDRNFSVLTVGLVCTFYATLGGMKAVLITDVFQTLLMYVSIFSIIIGVGIKLGGLDEVWRLAMEGGRIDLSVVSIDPTVRHSYWTQLIGGAVIFLAMFGINPAQVQRMLTAKDLKTTQQALWLCLPLLCLLSLSGCFAGLCLYAYYQKCDPLLEGRITNREQLMPLFVSDTMSHIPGLAGLFTAGIFSASLSTISGIISSLAAVTLEDFIKQIFLHRKKRQLSERSSSILSKSLTLFYGVLCIGMSYLSGALGGLLQAALTIFSIFGGPLLGLFLNGMCFKYVNQKGVLTGLFLGIAITLWISFGGPKPSIPSLSLTTEGCPLPKGTTEVLAVFTQIIEAREAEPEYFYLYTISYMWYPVVGFLTSFIVGNLTSLIYAQLKLDNNNIIYTDESRTIIKHELFMPPIARSIAKSQEFLVSQTVNNIEKCEEKY